MQRLLVFVLVFDTVFDVGRFFLSFFLLVLCASTTSPFARLCCWVRSISSSKYNSQILHSCSPMSLFVWLNAIPQNRCCEADFWLVKSPLCPPSSDCGLSVVWNPRIYRQGLSACGRFVVSSPSLVGRMRFVGLWSQHNLGSVCIVYIQESFSDCIGNHRNAYTKSCLNSLLAVFRVRLLHLLSVHLSS